jgi:hypothetical protein
MAVTALGGLPLLLVGSAGRQGTSSVSGLSNTQLDATNEAAIMYGRVITEDGASHTINTTGSSALGWRTGTVTFANAGSTVKVGLAPLDTTTGVPARASNSSDVIAFDVSASFTGGGGGITTTAWQESVPTSGTKTIANGDLLAFAVQMTTRGGASDTVQVSAAGSLQTEAFPGSTDFTGAAYASLGRLPNAVITFSDGTLGFFYGAYVASVGLNNQTWDNTSGTKEYGNLIQLPVPATAFGISAFVTVTGDADLILYSNPLGTPVAEKTVSVDKDTVALASSGAVAVPFASSFSMAANTPYAAIVKPTSATSITAPYITLNASAHQKAHSLGANAYAISRNTGAFAVQNANKDRYAIGLLVGAFEAGGGATRDAYVVASL